MWLFLGVIAAVLAVAGIAEAGTFGRAPREDPPQSWRGKGEPPPGFLPRPKFKVGQRVVDTSTGKPRACTVAEIEGAKVKGQWRWTYVMTDGSGAAEATLRAAAQDG